MTVRSTIVAALVSALLTVVPGGHISPAEIAAWQPSEHVMMQTAQPSDADFEAGYRGSRRWRVHFSGIDHTAYAEDEVSALQTLAHHVATSYAFVAGPALTAGV